MSQENVEIVRKAYAAHAAHDNESVFSFYDPEVEIRGGVLDANVYRGLDGVREFFRDWVLSFEGFGSEVDEWIDAGGDHVIAVVHSWGRGKQSGVHVDLRHAQLWTLRNGKLSRLVIYSTTEEALEAAGLRE